MSKATPAFGARRLGRPADALICCWGRCGVALPADAEVPLCREHHFRAWYAWQQAEVGGIHERAMERLATRAAERLDERVYFVRFGDRVKIGYTTDVLQRLKAVPHDDVLLVMPGTRLDERRVHAAFAHLRITGEWFRAGDDLLAFVADLAARHTASTGGV